MAKHSVKGSKRSEPPAELNFKKLKFVGFGLGALDRYEAEKSRTVVLDEDVAAVFQDAKGVNSVLRAFIKATTTMTKGRRRKSA